MHPNTSCANIPIQETINIIINKLFSTKTEEQSDESLSY